MKMGAAEYYRLAPLVDRTGDLVSTFLSLPYWLRDKFPFRSKYAVHAVCDGFGQICDYLANSHGVLVVSRQFEKAIHQYASDSVTSQDVCIRSVNGVVMSTNHRLLTPKYRVTGNERTCAKYDRDASLPKIVVPQSGSKPFSQRKPLIYVEAIMTILVCEPLAEYCFSQEFSGVEIQKVAVTLER